MSVAEEPGILSEQPSPFSVWLDLNVLSRTGASKPAMPIWFESFQNEPVRAKDGASAGTVYRLRMRRMPSLHRELLLRVFFEDIKGAQPVITVWTESGREVFRSAPLGAGTGLSTNETIVVPIEGADYLDIAVTGDGSSVRGVFASSLRQSTTKETIDFQRAPAIQDPFDNLPGTKPKDQDQKLFGRVKATVDTGVVNLSRNGESSAQWQFQLSGQPLTAVVTFEVLHADLAAPPVVVANEGPSGAASVHWPDLSDPGYRGESRPLEPSMRFQYTGWLRAQYVIPGHLLHSGMNQVTVGLPDDSGTVAIRNVELQLKHNWKQFDYILTPASK
jgi:hypothetical protein